MGGTSSLLVEHACKGDIGGVDMFVLHHPDTINMQADNGMTALIGATLHGQRKILELLLNKGADIDGTDERGITALMHACRAGDKEIAEYLISRGASVNIIGKKVIDEVTRRTIHGRTALQEACIAGYTPCVKLLAERGADLNAFSTSGKSALEEACESGCIESVEVLLRYGANADSAILSATNKGYSDDVVDLLSLHLEPKEVSTITAIASASRSEE